MRTRVLAAFLVAVALPAVASAQSAKDKQRASAKVKDAIAKSQAGDHEQAIELYQEAYKIIPQPLLLSNIGSEYQQLKKPVEALGFFCKYLAADPGGSNAGYVTAQAKTLYIELGGTPDVSDADVCKPLVKAPPPKPVEPVTPDPDGTPMPDEPAAVDKPSMLPWVGVSVGAVGVVMFGVGVYYGLQAKQISDDITNHPVDQPWPADILDRQADGETYGSRQKVFMISGGVVAVAGAALFVLTRPKSSREATVVAPVATGDSVGLVAAGRF